MRERAMLAGGRLTIGPSDLGGTEVRLLIPKATPPP
jgi:signal transduction histidine kinase